MHLLGRWRAPAAALTMLGGLIMACGLLLGGGAAWAQGAAIDIGGTFHAGQPKQVAWRVIKPADWNGTLVLDLDFAPGGYAGAQRTWFLERGYAIGGIQRTQNETAYELKLYVDDLVTVRENLIAAGSGVPLRTIAFGASRGAFVSRKAVEYRPDIFVGAVAFAGGGSGVIAAWLGKADAVWALKMLVNPASPLTINRLPDIAPGATYGPNYAQDVALGQLVTLARSTTQGMARLVLAGAFEQATGWGSGSVQPAADDYELQGNLVASSFAFGNPQFVHKEIEVMAGGPVVWNHGVDYRDLLDRSGDRARVEYWYDKAGLDLEADLDYLNSLPRYSADPAAVQRVEDIGTYTAQTGGPVFSAKTIGDSADPVSLDEAYVRTFAAAGTSAQLRTAFIRRSGHSSQSLRERLTAFETLIDRLDTGVWPDTSADALNARAANVGAGTTVTSAQLGTSVYLDYDLTPALRTWDFSNWGEYFGLYLDSLAVAQPDPLRETLAAFVHHLRKGHLDAACHQLDNFAKHVEKQSRLPSSAAAELGSDLKQDLLGKFGRLEAELGCP